MSKVKKIVDALYNVDGGEQVFEALTHVPTDNLHHMYHMIEFILTGRMLLKEENKNEENKND